MLVIRTYLHGTYAIFVGKNMPDIIQAKIQSRHVTSKSCYLWLQSMFWTRKTQLKFSIANADQGHV